jgi:hypothetical protein
MVPQAERVVARAQLSGGPGTRIRAMIGQVDIDREMKEPSSLERRIEATEGDPMSKMRGINRGP